MGRGREQGHVRLPGADSVPAAGAGAAEAAYNYPKYSAPFRKLDNFVYSKNDGLQNQSVVYIQKGLEGTPEVFVDPNKFSADGTSRLGGLELSKNGRYATYMVSSGGSDWEEASVVEVATKKLLDDHLKWIKFSGAAWFGDGFFYSRFPAPEGGHDLSAKNENMMVYFHRVGTPQEQDELIYADKAHPQREHGVGTTEDERFAFLVISDPATGKKGNALSFRDLSKGEKTWTPIVAAITDDEYGPIDNAGGKFLIRTNHGAPNGKVVLYDPSKPNAPWSDVIPEKPEAMESATTAGGKLFVTYLKDVTTRAYVYSLDGKLENEIQLPGPGTAGGFGGNHDDKFVFYTFTSLDYPPTIFRYDIATRASTLFRAPRIPGFDPANYEEKQVFFMSKDGTRIPMFLIHKKGLKLDGTNPTLLYGYGGFNITMNPAFSSTRLALLEQRVVFTRWPTCAAAASTARSWHEGGHEAAQAECLRRFHRRRGVADRAALHVAAAPGDEWRLERRAAGRGRDQPAARAISRGSAAGGRDGHAAVPQVHDRLGPGSRTMARATTRSSSRRFTNTRRCTTFARA